MPKHIFPLDRLNPLLTLRHPARGTGYVLERIPECIGVEIDNIEDLDDADKLGDPADLLEGKDRL